jgi:hypothetical protein
LLLVEGLRRINTEEATMLADYFEDPSHPMTPLHRQWIKNVVDQAPSQDNAMRSERVPSSLTDKIISLARQRGYWGHGVGKKWDSALSGDMRLAQRNSMLRVILDQKIKIDLFSLRRAMSVGGQIQAVGLFLRGIYLSISQLIQFFNNFKSSHLGVSLAGLVVGITSAVAGLGIINRYYGPFGDTRYLFKVSMRPDVYGPYWVVLDRNFYTPEGDDYREFLMNYIKDMPNKLKRTPYLWKGMKGEHHLAYLFPDDDLGFFQDGIHEALKNGKMSEEEAQNDLHRLVTYSEFISNDGDIEEILRLRINKAMTATGTQDLKVSKAMITPGNEIEELKIIVAGRLRGVWGKDSEFMAEQSVKLLRLALDRHHNLGHIKENVAEAIGRLRSGMGMEANSINQQFVVKVAEDLHDSWFLHRGFLNPQEDQRIKYLEVFLTTLEAFEKNKELADKIKKEEERYSFGAYIVPGRGMENLAHPIPIGIGIDSYILREPYGSGAYEHIPEELKIHSEAIYQNPASERITRQIVLSLTRLGSNSNATALRKAAHTVLSNVISAISDQDLKNHFIAVVPYFGFNISSHYDESLIQLVVTEDGLPLFMPAKSGAVYKPSLTQRGRNWIRSIVRKKGEKEEAGSAAMRADENMERQQKGQVGWVGNRRLKIAYIPGRVYHHLGDDTYVRVEFDDQPGTSSKILAGSIDTVMPTPGKPDKAALAEPPGGIDLNSANLAMLIKRDGKGVVLPLAQQDLAQLSNIEGLDPVILSIKPASETPVFSQLQTIS